MRRALALAALTLCGMAMTVAPRASASHYVATAPSSAHGVDVFFDNSTRLSDGRVIARARELFSYISSLGANAVSLNFPLTMSSATASTVAPTLNTPSPALMRSVIDVARSDRLMVQLRPLVLLVGGNLNNWRGAIAPKDVGEWFHAYWESLEPYALVAAQTGVSSFSIGAEFNSLVEDAPVAGAKPWGYHNDIPFWLQLVQQFQAILGNRLLYSAGHGAPQSIPGISFGFDEYSPVLFAPGNSPKASTPTAQVVAEFTASMEATMHKAGFPALSAMSFEEAGIGAYYGAWTTPWITAPGPGTSIARWVQTDWDTALCNVYLANHMAGLYFWNVDLPQFTPRITKADTDNFGGFQGTATATAIKSCFAKAGGRS